MKFFAPKNNWDMRSDSSWWPMLGSAQSSAGVRVSHDSAMTYSAVFAATRVISETLASLPFRIMEQVDERTRRKAMDHALWPILHDQPNPEQDIMAFLDFQVAIQVNWGNCFAEMQRDSTGKVVALWPIHASRIPKCNIKRNPRRGEPGWDRVVAGQLGEKVYYVRNDDGTVTPLPASDMLHIPGVQPDDGYGRSIVIAGAETIGIALATERHAGAFFRNGAVSNMAIKSPKMVKKETAEYLREQWQKTFGGVHNHYKTLLLEDGMEPVSFSIAPEASQLIEARKFSIREIARIYRVPPHMIADMLDGVRANVEAEGISFVVNTMRPWVVRWEKALRRQLLTEEEKRTYFFNVNMMGLLRGDSAARAQYYKMRFDMGSLSPNDIRELEDENPVDGGDQYFVAANNLMPLDKIGELAQAQIDKLNEPAPVPAGPQPDEGDPDEEVEDKRWAEVLARLDHQDTLDMERLAIRQQKVQESEELLREGLRVAIEARITGLTEYECRAIRQATNKPGGFPTWQTEFYGEMCGKLADALRPFVKPAERLGFEFNADAVAGNYCSDSMKLLEPLLDVSCGQLAEVADGIVSLWSQRPSGVADFIIPRRSQQCAA